MRTSLSHRPAVTPSPLAPPDPFPPTREEALARIARIDPQAYARTRNALDGAVTRLSPYITHGLVSLPEVIEGVCAARPDWQPRVQDRLVFELGWREYFRHVREHRGDAILHALHAGPLPDAAYARELPDDVREGRTGVPAIDRGIAALLTTGHLHNHARLWLASYLVHLRKVHWRTGADWMLAHLLDGDLASNHLSWQWVAGTGSHQPYLFDAANVARHAPPPWHSPGTPIDLDREALEALARSRQPVRTRPLAQGLAPPPVLRDPPADLGCGAADDALAERLRGQDVWLVHPWALGEVPAGWLPVGVLIDEWHAAWPWSAARWRFVGARMAALAPWRARAGAARWRRVLAGARRVESVANHHLEPWLGTLARLHGEPRLFPAIERPCQSFSQWWSRASRQATRFSGAFHDPERHRAGDRRTRWHRP